LFFVGLTIDNMLKILHIREEFSQNQKNNPMIMKKNWIEEA